MNMTEQKEGYFIRAGAMSWDLVKQYRQKEGKRKGQLTTTVVGYFKNKEQAANRMIDLLVREGLSDRELSANEVLHINEVVGEAMKEVLSAIPKE